MLRVSTLTAWAELEVASAAQAYLKAVLQPYRAILASLWIASLRDYASIRADSEVLQESASGAMDVAYTGLGREVLLPVGRPSPFPSGETIIRLNTAVLFLIVLHRLVGEDAPRGCHCDAIRR